ncbi:phage minor head protein [Azospirillum sp. A39]|uniref:phage minor head protein n=1 Tax=Azospirillum sp. A39 TaxID=3462279 RepID=UPI0040457A1E
MTTDDRERDRAFREKRRRQIEAAIRIRAETEAELLRLLKEAQTEIQAALAAAPSDYQTWRLTELRSEVARVVGELERAASAAATGGLTKSWDAGVHLVDAPLDAAGLSVAGRLVALDTSVLVRMRAFLVDRIRNVTTEIMNRVASELGLVMIGTRSPFEAVRTVAEIVGTGGRNRAVTIVRTELGRAWSTAAQARMEQAAAAGVRLRKQWRRSGKRHPRHSHEAIDGQVRKVDEPFLLEGGVRLMFPRDPRAPAKETINCGCLSLPIVASWEVLHPRERPFTREELDTSPHRRLLEDARFDGFARWADGLFAGTLKPDGRFETVGRLDDATVAELARRKIMPATREIAVADKQLLHLRRDAKRQPLPTGLLKRLPELMAAPKAIYWDTHTRSLVYVLDTASDAEGRVPRVSVKVRDRDRRLKHQAHNWIATAGWEEAAHFAAARFVAVQGVSVG